MNNTEKQEDITSRIQYINSLPSNEEKKHYLMYCVNKIKSDVNPNKIIISFMKNHNLNDNDLFNIINSEHKEFNDYKEEIQNNNEFTSNLIDKINNIDIYNETNLNIFFNNFTLEQLSYIGL